jgi:hypothetical protein
MNVRVPRVFTRTPLALHGVDHAVKERLKTNERIEKYLKETKWSYGDSFPLPIISIRNVKIPLFINFISNSPHILLHQ